MVRYHTRRLSLVLAVSSLAAALFAGPATTAACEWIRLSDGESVAEWKLLNGGEVHTKEIPPSATVPAGRIELVLRRRVKTDATFGEHAIVETREAWDPCRSAVIVCDMWDTHTCRNAALRVAEIAPRMNCVVERVRSLGGLIIHAPSSCMKAYAEHPARQRALDAPHAPNLPPGISKWLSRIPSEEAGIYPIDQTDGGCDTPPSLQDPFRAKLVEAGRNPDSPWLRQIDTISIDDGDVISDSGVEIWNVLEERGIDNVIVVGVHTNMCVLGRPFGLRQMAKNGKNVVLLRDMTDTMYNPAQWPYVNHFRGTERIIEHIEKFVCPTATSANIVSGPAFEFKDDTGPKVVVAIAEPEYRTEETLPELARKVFGERLGCTVEVLFGDTSKHDIPGLERALTGADALVLSVRRQALPATQIEAVQTHLEAGKALLAIRTSSHAFHARGRGPRDHVEWEGFDPEVLGGHYHGHHGNGPVARITAVHRTRTHPVLSGVRLPFESQGSLYRVMPLAESTTPLLIGEIDDPPSEPVAWLNRYGPKRARIFYTSLGHVSDFEGEGFRRLLENAIQWALARPVRPSAVAAELDPQGGGAGDGDDRTRAVDLGQDVDLPFTHFSPDVAQIDGR